MSRVKMSPWALKCCSRTHTVKTHTQEKWWMKKRSWIPADRDSEAETDRLQGSSETFLVCNGPPHTHTFFFAMRGNRNCDTWLLWVQAATSQQWNVILSATVVHSDCCCCLAVEESELGLRVVHPKESRFHIQEWNAFWHFSASPWFE